MRASHLFSTVLVCSIILYCIRIRVNGQNSPCGGKIRETTGMLRYIVNDDNDDSCLWTFDWGEGAYVELTLIGWSEYWRIGLSMDEEIWHKGNRFYKPGRLLFNNMKRKEILFFGLKDGLHFRKREFDWIPDSENGRRGFILLFKRSYSDRECVFKEDQLDGTLFAKTRFPKCSWSLTPKIPTANSSELSKMSATSYSTNYYIALFFSADFCNGKDEYTLKSGADDILESEKAISCKCGSSLPEPIFTFSKSITIHLVKPRDELPNLFLHYSTLPARNYGESCSVDNLKFCNPFKRLTCQEDKCKCLYPDEMMFNEIKGMCVSKPRGKCSLPPNELKGNVNTALCMAEDIDPEITLANPRISIICTSNGTCGCNEGHFESPKFTSEKHYKEFCLPKKKFGEECGDSNQCLSPLICYKGFCNCDKPSGHTNASEEGHCVGDVQGPCLGPDLLCVNNTECNKGLMICECSKGLMESLDNRTCQAGHGQYCSQTGNVSCSGKFVCINSKCQCKNPTRSRYNPERRKCLGILYGDCEGSQDCWKHMECRLKSNGKQCLCSKGYKSDEKGICRPEYGTVCDETLEGECDNKSRIYCVDGKCSCHDNLYKYNKDTMKCLGIDEAHCDLDSNCEDSFVCKKEHKRQRGLCKFNPQKRKASGAKSRTMSYGLLLLAILAMIFAK